MTTDEERRARQIKLISLAEQVVSNAGKIEKRLDDKDRNEKWIIGALVLIAILIGLVIYFIVDNKNAIKQINQERADRRTQIENQIDGLACLLVSQVPDDPKRPIIHEFRQRYHCPPFSKEAARKAKQHLKSQVRPTNPSQPIPSTPPNIAQPTPDVRPTTVVSTQPGVVVTHVKRETVTKTVTQTVTCAVVLNHQCVSPIPLPIPGKAQANANAAPNQEAGQAPRGQEQAQAHVCAPPGRSAGTPACGHQTHRHHLPHGQKRLSW